MKLTMFEKGVRKVVKKKKHYELLKPLDKSRENFHSYGERKSLHGVYDSMNSGKYRLILNSEVKQDLIQYEKNRTKRIQRHMSNLQEKLKN